MNQEKKKLQTFLSAGEYLAPRVKVVEVKVRRVMCDSNNLENNIYGGYSNSEQEG